VTVTPESKPESARFASMRRREFARLDATGQVYLDYTGACLYPESLVRDHYEMLATGIFGNPHSANSTSQASTRLIEETRQVILRFFNADPDEYEAVFTLNATGALKLVGESYPFGPHSPFALTYDNHNSVNGIREFARASGAEFHYVPITDPELRIDEVALESVLTEPNRGGGLFAFPAQSNFSGVQHDLSLIEHAQRLGWHVLLDAAAFVPTNPLDLSVYHPDFVPISFYKMFGYPTGVGCLLIRKESTAHLVRPWFAGGTVLLSRACMTSCEADMGYVWASGVAGFEDGTPSFLTVPAVKIGIEFLQSVGVDRLHQHIMSLAEDLLSRLVELKHTNGSRLLHMYGPETIDRRGGTFALNLFDTDGNLIHSRDVERAASARGISIRTGCHCNPGAGQAALHISDEEFERVFVTRESMSRDRFQLMAQAMQEGAVRASLGLASSRSDVDAFVGFLSSFVDCRPS
jgi:molybdenum cofactor sulfurtransferase